MSIDSEIESDLGLLIKTITEAIYNNTVFDNTTFSFDNTSYFDYSNFNLSDIWDGTDDKTDLIFSFQILVILSVIYVTLFISGMIGNLLTCIVIATNKSMHTATNFYLISLACSDILILLTNVPFTLYNFWSTDSNYDIYLTYAFFGEIASNSSILTVTILTVERYMAICYPFNKYSMSSLEVVRKYIIGVWVVSLFLSTFLGLLPEIVERNSLKISMLISVVMFYAAPIAIMSVLYSAIGFKLRKYSKDMTIQKKAIDEGKIIKMLVAILIVFILCWTPFHVDRILVAFRLVSYKDSKLAFAVASVLYTLSTTLNPILYSLMSKKFRKGFKELISKAKKKRNEISEMANGAAVTSSTNSTQTVEEIC